MTGKSRAAVPLLFAIALLSLCMAASALAAPPPAAAGAPPAYLPPPRGAPGGRVGGASRGTVKVTMALPTIDLLAPDSAGGETIDAAPTLYYYVSQAVVRPTHLTIRAPWQPVPVVDTPIPSPIAAGIYRVRLADYRVRLEPGVVYTWSVSIVINPQAPSRDIVASATLLRVPPDPGLVSSAAAAPPLRRAVLFAQAGLWYDAVAAAAEGENEDRHAALDALMRQVGLAQQADYDRQLAAAGG